MLESLANAFQNPVVVAIAVAVVGTVVGGVILKSFGLPVWLLSTFENPRTRRASAYRRIAKKLAFDAEVRKGLLKIINAPRFLDIAVDDVKYGKHAERDAFVGELAAANLVSEQEEQRLADQFYDAIHNHFRHSKFPSDRDIAKKWDRETVQASEQQFVKPSSSRGATTTPGYVTMIITGEDHFQRDVPAQTERFFQRHPSHIQQLPGWIMSSDGKFDTEKWKLLLGEVVPKLRQAVLDSWELHVTFGTLTLWNFALGTLLNNRFPLVLYHYQASGQESADGANYHRIWRIDRTVKDLRSPMADAPFRFIFCGTPTVLQEVEDRTLPEALIFSIGANDIEDAVLSFLEASGLQMSRTRIVKKRDRPLDPKQPQDWIRAAAELAFAIDQVSAADLYLFADMPTVLALMVGDSLGSHTDCRIHLMQHDAENQTYHEMLVLPDDELRELVN